MKGIKRLVAVIAAATALATGAVGLTANAADASLTINTSSGTLHNDTSDTHYGNVNFLVIKRSTGSQVASDGDSGNVPGYSSISAGVGGYTAVEYRFITNGTLYVGTSPYSGVLWSGSIEY